MYHDREIYTQPCDFPHRNSHSAYKGKDISVPMHLDKENYTQPCDFPHRNSHSAYKGKGHLRPYVPRQGNLYATLRFSSFGILLLRIKGRVSPSPCTSMRKFIRSLEISLFEFIVLRITSGASPSPCTSTGKFIRSLEISLFQNSHSAYKEKGRLRPHAPR